MKAFYRRYDSDRRDGRSSYMLHIVRDAPLHRPRFNHREPDVQRTECHVYITGGGDSTPVILDEVPAVPPAGYTWCPPCLGRSAARLGRLDDVAALLFQGE